jgi:hypothetical protein
VKKLRRLKNWSFQGTGTVDNAAAAAETSPGFVELP